MGRCHWPRRAALRPLQVPARPSSSRPPLSSATPSWRVPPSSRFALWSSAPPSWRVPPWSPSKPAAQSSGAATSNDQVAPSSSAPRLSRVESEPSDRRAPPMKGVVVGCSPGCTGSVDTVGRSSPPPHAVMVRTTHVMITRVRIHHHPPRRCPPAVHDSYGALRGIGASPDHGGSGSRGVDLLVAAPLEAAHDLHVGGLGEHVHEAALDEAVAHRGEQRSVPPE